MYVCMYVCLTAGGVIDGGTWEHRKRAKEMMKTADTALELTLLNKGKHHIAQFLPKVLVVVVVVVIIIIIIIIIPIVVMVAVKNSSTITKRECSGSSGSSTLRISAYMRP